MDLKCAFLQTYSLTVDRNIPESECLTLPSRIWMPDTPFQNYQNDSTLDPSLFPSKNRVQSYNDRAGCACHNGGLRMYGAGW